MTISFEGVQDFIGTWEQHFQRLNENPDLPKSDKVRLVKSQKMLQRVFNDKWLWEQAANGFIHPLLSQLTNLATYSQEDLAELGEQIEFASSFMNFNHLKGRLHQSTQYYGALAEIRTLYKLAPLGRNNLSLFPEVEIGRGKRFSDIKVNCESEDVYVEVTTLRDSDEERRANETFNGLYWPIIDTDVIRYMQIYKPLAKPRIAELKMKIDELVSDVKQNGGHRHIHEPGVIDCLILPRSEGDSAKTFAKKYGMKAETTGPSYNTNDIPRIKRDVWQKAHGQIPPHRPGIIVLYGDLVSPFEKPEVYYPRFVYELEDTVYDCENLVALVVMNPVACFGENQLLHGPNFDVSIEAEDGSVHKTTLVLKNRYSPFAESPGPLRVIKALIS